VVVTSFGSDHPDRPACINDQNLPLIPPEETSIKIRIPPECRVQRRRIQIEVFTAHFPHVCENVEICVCGKKTETLSTKKLESDVWESEFNDKVELCVRIMLVHYLQLVF
jgi:hypothetical protein